jgi:hypothetical protein
MNGALGTARPTFFVRIRAMPLLAGVSSGFVRFLEKVSFFTRSQGRVASLSPRPLVKRNTDRHALWLAFTGCIRDL